MRFRRQNSLLLDMDELNLQLIIRVVSIISLSEVVGSNFPALCLLLVQLKIYILNTKIILVW